MIRFDGRMDMLRLEIGDDGQSMRDVESDNLDYYKLLLQSGLQR